MTSRYGVLGAGAHAAEVVETCCDAPPEFYALSAAYLQASNAHHIAIESPGRAHSSVPVVAAVGAPGLRRRLVETWPGNSFATIVAPGARVSVSSKIGRGSTVMEGTVISARVAIGEHALINIGCTVSHDSVLGDYVTLAPGVHIAGQCTIGDGVFLGIGTAVSDGVSIAPGTTIGAGAAVVNDIDVPGTYVGVPAKLVRENEEWLSEF